MKVNFSPQVQREIRKIYYKDRKLYNRVNKQIELFKTNPNHPSLRLHTLSGSMSNQFSISVTMSIRMVYVLLDEQTTLFTKIGTHKEVYEK